MKGRIAVSLRLAEELGRPAAKAGTTGQVYVELLLAAVSNLSKEERYKGRTAVRTFGRWLDRQDSGPDSELRVDETLFWRWRKEMKEGVFRRQNGKPYSDSMTHSVTKTVMRLHNTLPVGRKGTRRKLVALISYERLSAFSKLTEVTQKAMLWYEERGTCAPSKNGETRLQTTKTRKNALSEAFTVLRAMDLRGLELIAPDLVEAYMGKPDEDDPVYRRRYRSLHNLRALTSACCREGLLHSDPLGTVGNKIFPSSGITDFVPPEGVEKLLDTSTVDLHDTQQVTDRLVCLLYFDLALRRDELEALDISQVRTEGNKFAVMLRPEDQKMTGKSRTPLYNYYPSTGELLAHYLRHVRPKLSRECPALFVHARGGRERGTSLADRVKRECERRKVFCYYRPDALPSPHALRRTFGTINIDDLGLGLSVLDIARRLRDSTKVVENHYVVNNPLTAQMKADQHRKHSGYAPTPQDAERALGVLREFGITEARLKLVRRDVAAASRPEGSTGGMTASGGWIPKDEGLALLRLTWRQLPNERNLHEYLRLHELSRRMGSKGVLHYSKDWTTRMANDYRPLTSIAPSFTAKHIERRPWLSANALFIGRFVLIPTNVALRLMQELNDTRPKNV